MSMSSVPEISSGFIITLITIKWLLKMSGLWVSELEFLGSDSTERKNHYDALLKPFGWENTELYQDALPYWPLQFAEMPQFWPLSCWPSKVQPWHKWSLFFYSCVEETAQYTFQCVFILFSLWEMTLHWYWYWLMMSVKKRNHPVSSWQGHGYTFFFLTWNRDTVSETACR